MTKPASGSGILGCVADMGTLGGESVKRHLRWCDNQHVSKLVCGICGAQVVPHEDGDGSYRRVEPHYDMCASFRLPIITIDEVPDTWQRPTADEFDAQFAPF